MTTLTPDMKTASDRLHDQVGVRLEDIGPETKLKDLLERRTCGRCGGTGHYFNYGACFTCGGSGGGLTGRGAAASRLYRDLTHVPIEQVRVGDLVTIPGVPGFSGATRGRVIYVADLGDGRVRLGFKPRPRLAAMGAWYSDTETAQRGTKYQVALTPEMNQAARRTVAEYQAMLTKAGKPMKASRYAPLAA